MDQDSISPARAAETPQETPAAQAVPAIDVLNVSKLFGEGQSAVRALDDVSVAIGENAFFTLLGPSGCGKTTLLRLIAGFDHPSAGQILLRGEDISELPPNQRSVNTVFQSYALFPHMTVRQNIGFGPKMLGWDKARIDRTVTDMLALVRMEALADRRTDQISGGQQQRVALARALAPRPKVLLLDEPLSALDYKLRKEMQTELKRLQHETGITFIFVTHDQEEALTMSDRIAVMSAGRILQIGSPREIYLHPRERFVADFIGDTNFLAAEVIEAGGGMARLRLAGGGEAEATVPEGVAATGRVTASVRPEQARLVAPGQGALTGRVAGRVYFGTDTLVTLRLADDSAFTLRVQNSLTDGEPPGEGAEAGIALAPGALQVLRD
ncbi:ABC transporter ATP-binding protein [Paralimibaculum aggregatum]|nr:ABC transporter ATP-binding protein [Limibaculum sp. NKW23]